MISSNFVLSSYNAVKIRECARPKFMFARPFSFLCNADRECLWTPDRIFEELGITDFGNLRFVSVHLTSANLDNVLLAIEAWNEARFRVTIKFPVLKKRPVVGTIEDPTFFGLDVESCYLLRNRNWMSSGLLRHAVAEAFKGDSLVRVDA
jgi:hypothetical protein